MRARFFDRQDGEIIRNSKHRAPFLAELVPDTGTTLLIGLGSNGGCAQLLHFLKLGKSTRLERGRKSKLRVVVVQRVEGRRCAVTPAVRHDPEGFDEALPAAREGDRHAEVEDLVVAEVPAQVVVERLVDRRSLAGQPVGEAQRCRSEEHTSELQSRLHLVCRLLLEKKKKKKHTSSCALCSLEL